MAENEKENGDGSQNFQTVAVGNDEKEPEIKYSGIRAMPYIIGIQLIFHSFFFFMFIGSRLSKLCFFF